jgi:hypothetical protein
MKDKRNEKLAFQAPSVAATHVKPRTGKHQMIVSEILSQLAGVDEYTAVKMDLTKVGTTMGAFRAAIHRAAKKQKLPVTTTSNETQLYVFLASPKTGPGKHHKSGRTLSVKQSRTQHARSRKSGKRR